MSRLLRIHSQVYRNLCSMREDSFKLTDIFVWPLLVLLPLFLFTNYIGADIVFTELIVLGFTGSAMMESLGQGVLRSFMEEYWSGSLPYLFASPIERIEFVLGAAISSILKAVFTIGSYLIFAALLIGFFIGNWPIFFISMLFFAIIGCSIGLVALGIAYYVNAKNDVVNINIIFIEFIALASGIFYSVESVYPPSLLPIINLLPTTQAFNLLKSMLGLGTVDLPVLVFSTAAALVGAYLFNGWMYKKAKKIGRLARFN